MPQMNNPRALFLHELGDALTFERAIVGMLPKLQQEASDRELSQGFQKHIKQSQRHAENIEKAFRAVGETPQPQRCPGIEGIRAEHDQFVKERPSKDVLDSFLAGAAAKTEHYEIATYEGLVSKARALGEKQAADLLERNLKEDKAVLQQVQKVGRRLARDGAKQLKEQQKAQEQGRAATGGRGRAAASSRSGGSTRSSASSRSGGSSRTGGGRTRQRRTS